MTDSKISIQSPKINLESFTMSSFKQKITGGVIMGEEVVCEANGQSERDFHLGTELEEGLGDLRRSVNAIRFLFEACDIETWTFKDQISWFKLLGFSLDEISKDFKRLDEINEMVYNFPARETN